MAGCIAIIASAKCALSAGTQSLGVATHALFPGGIHSGVMPQYPVVHLCRSGTYAWSEGSSRRIVDPHQEAESDEDVI